MSKRINRKDYERLKTLNEQLCVEFAGTARQSITIWRGDVRAIQWAAWWIRETLAEAERRLR